jgi:flagellar basal body-associated protein FliL
MLTESPHFPHNDFFLNFHYHKTVIRILPPGSRFSHILYIVLLSLAAAIILLIIIGTVFALVRSPAAAPVITLGTLPAETQNAFTQTDDIRVYSGLGRLRVPLANSSILILSISFPYSADDIAFTEELAAHVNDFRDIASGYFSSLPANSLARIDEDAAKTEILRRFNENLRLGRISALYFNDFMVLD